MAATDRPNDPDALGASELATAIADAPFVRLLARADGASVAAAGLLAAACTERSIPFQASVRPTEGNVAGRGDGLVVGIGIDTDGSSALTSNRTLAAYESALDLGCDPDPILAAAGLVADGGDLTTDEGGDLLADAAIERRPGVGVPTADVSDGLAHTTFVHTSFSGDETAAGAALADLEDDAPEAVASLLALATIESSEASARAAESVERVLRPHASPTVPLETVEGLADVLDCVARERPGTALALAMGHDVRVEALDAWRCHAKRAHTVLETATTGRYDGLFVARVESGPIETLARLVRDVRSPEPVALVLAEGEAAAASVEGHPIDRTTNEAAAAVDGAASATVSRGYARFDGEPEGFLTAFREVL
ncbi:exonuclease RecJ [Natronorarus salvus]|uniref:exonuclease RecJ n=1 Tax=Natronorarus salvus TaxID=3117733 RepID=UPI002F267D33